MTLAAQNTWTVEDANGVKTAFGIGFKVYDTSAIEVLLLAEDGTETVQTAGVDYAVTGAPGAYQVDFAGLAGAPADGLQVAIRPTLAASQGAAFDDFSKFPASKTEEALDRAFHLIQALAARLDRTVRVPADEAGKSIPGSASRAYRLAAYDGAGAPVTGPLTSLIEGLLNLNSDAEDWGLVNEGVDEVVDWGSVA